MSTTLLALYGGLLIGLAVSLLWLFNGRIAGVSGILRSAIHHQKTELWHWLFIAGLLIGGAISHWGAGVEVPTLALTHPVLAVIAGLFVGIGTAIGSGCTSGHGICGTSRFSSRSIVSTMTFMAFGMLTVFIMRVFA